MPTLFPAQNGCFLVVHLWRLLRTAHRGSQVPIPSLFVDRIGMQPRVRQQAITIVSTIARRTGRLYAKRQDRETHVQHSNTDKLTKSDRKSLQCLRIVTRSINDSALVSHIQVLISRTCDHPSFPVGTLRCHRSLPWALRLPSDHRATA